MEYGIKASNPFISLAAIDAIIQCLLYENKHPIYSSFKEILLMEKSKKVGIDYQKLALEKLWALLDYPYMHSKIIDLIVAYSKYFPFEFSETVKKSFTVNNPQEK